MLWWPTIETFLVALDDCIDSSPLGYVSQGFELYGIAERAALTKSGDKSAFRWTGELVHLGYVVHGLPAAGDRRPIPQGTLWTEYELQRLSDCRVTAQGREEADRIRRQRREALTDAAMGAVPPEFLRPWMTDVQRRAVSEPLANLRAALDGDTPQRRHRRRQGPHGGRVQGRHRACGRAGSFGRFAVGAVQAGGRGDERRRDRERRRTPPGGGCASAQRLAKPRRRRAWSRCSTGHQRPWGPARGHSRMRLRSIRSRWPAVTRARFVSKVAWRDDGHQR